MNQAWPMNPMSPFVGALLLLLAGAAPPPPPAPPPDIGALAFQPCVAGAATQGFDIESINNGAESAADDAPLRVP